MSGHSREIQTKKLVDFLVAWPDGDEIVTHEQIEKVIGEKHGTAGYQSVVNKARRRIEEAGRTMRAIPGIGYRLPKAGDHLHLRFKRTKRLSRRIGYEAAVVSRIVTTELTDKERLAQAMYMDRVMTHQQVLAADLKASSTPLIPSPTKTLPQ
jgi:hypothetical protein